MQLNPSRPTYLLFQPIIKIMGDLGVRGSTENKAEVHSQWEAASWIHKQTLEGVLSLKTLFWILDSNEKVYFWYSFQNLCGTWIIYHYVTFVQ